MAAGFIANGAEIRDRNGSIGAGRRDLNFNTSWNLPSEAVFSFKSLQAGTMASRLCPPWALRPDYDRTLGRLGGVIGVGHLALPLSVHKRAIGVTM